MSEWSQTFGNTVDFITFILPYFIFFFLCVMIYKKWIDYVQEKFSSSLKYVLLRIYPPKEVMKTPAAMELFLNAFHQTGGEGTWYAKKWLGKARPVFSLEIASNGGEVGFYIRTRADLRREIETQIYAQYPGIEVHEVEDYVEKVDFYSGNYAMYGCEYKLAKADPWPIKTYVDFGLDKVSEEEEKADPITLTLELLGSLKAGENMWIQIITKAHKKEDKKHGTFFDVVDNWQEDAKSLIKEIREETVIEREDGTTTLPQPTKGQADQIAAIERSVSKLGFDCGIRGVYIAEKDVFQSTTIGALRGTFKQYGSELLNNIKPDHDTGTDFPWQEWWNPGKTLQSQMFDAYKERTYFNTSRVYVNFFGFTSNILGFQHKKDRVKMVLNSEELATIFHFPGTVAATPSLSRVSSRKGEAPSNLPI